MRAASVIFALLFFTMVGSAQTAKPAAPAAKPAAKPAAQAPAKPAAGAPVRVTAKVQGNLAQVMRGILFPNSNIIFDAQNNDPTKKKADEQFGNPYGGWQNVENAAIALAEASNLLIIPGRVCSNGKPAPNAQPDWPKLVQGLRDASMASYKAAQSKNMDNIVDAAGTLTEACSACHDKYREKPNLSLRCTP
jgi:cytochrome c556